MSLKDQLTGLKASAAELQQSEPDTTQPRRAHSVPTKRAAASVRPAAASEAYSSLQPPAKVHLVNFPLRLSTGAIDTLNQWKDERRIVPGLLVREIVEKGIAELARSFEKEGVQ